MQLKYKSSEDFFSREYGVQFYSEKSRPIMVAINLRSPSNIGGIIRLAGNLGCKKVIFAGEKIDFKQAKIKKSASNAFDKIEHKLISISEWENEIPLDYEKVAIETAEGATNIYQTQLPEKIAFVVGDEREGIPEAELKKCSSAVYIPMTGITLSMNVIQSAAVVSFEWIRQQTLNQNLDFQKR